MCYKRAMAITPVQAPLIGAIRWDAWHGDRGVPGRAVQHALAPREWHGRLPFFARIVADDAVLIDGTPQEVMDAEIGFARRGGLDYWAFVAYAPDDAMSLALRSYLASRKRSLIRFCLVAECGRWRDPAYVARLADLMGEPGYLAVCGGRPVLYLGFIDEAKIKANWGSVEGLRAVVDGLRAAAVQRGLQTPYLVIMDFNPERGKRWLDALGADAISSYAVGGGDTRAPYARLAANAELFWERCKATGAQVVPIVMSGWDRRPRIARPMPWETWQKPGEGMDRYFEPPTPAELAGHLRRAVAWMAANPAQAQAALAIVYAWNENDEGGWLVPTLSEGAARLEALAEALGRQPPSGAEGGGDR